MHGWIFAASGAEMLGKPCIVHRTFLEPEYDTP